MPAFVAATAFTRVRSPGRDGPFGPPPGQNPASGFPAPGSHFGSTECEPFGLVRCPIRSRYVGAPFPTLSWGRVSCSGFPLSRGPSLHRLDGRYPRLRRLLWYYVHVRLLGALTCRLRPKAFLQLLSAHLERAMLLRDLPAPVQESFASVPNSLTAG